MLNAFKNLSIRLKLLCGFGVIGFLLVIIGGLSIVGMNRLNGNAEFIYKTNLLGVTVMSELRAQMLRRNNFVVWHILANDSATMAAREKSITELDKEIEDLLAKYVPLIVVEEEKKVFAKLQAGIPEYMEARKKVLQLSKNYSKDAAAEVQKTELAEKIGVLYDAVDWLVKENNRQAEESYQSGRDLSTSLNWGMSILNICALLIGAFTVWFVSRSIVENLMNVLDAANQLQNGNLTHRSTVTVQDEIGKLATAFNQMATQIEANVREALESKYKIEAVSKAQAVIEFNVDGTIMTANQNFLSCLGYTLDEIKGHHQRMLAEPAYAASAEYQAFWDKLNRGEFDAGVYRRVGKGGKEIWIQASYNPILDGGGKVSKIVAFATDITGQKQAQSEVEKLIKAAAMGNLSDRIDVGRFQGSAKDLTSSFNQLLDAVVTPLHEAQSVLTALASGDLTKQMTGAYQGEFEQMKTSLNTAITQLTQTVSLVREAVESVTAGSEEISKGSDDLAKRTSEQAGALEETSASMEEMTSTVKQNADNSKQANQLAIAARDIANKGGAVTTRAVDAMGEINKSSKKIADIITVIDEIAFQTNLLALNAAVEAARAGEHGRGFAVVAAEVRNLAQRSATAAKEIKGLINESIQRVTDGTELVNQSGKTLEEIVGSVKRVTDIIAEISAASQEQASGIDQVNKAIMQMDEGTQQNAALVEETASASQSMKEQAKELMRQVEVFKIQQSESRRTAAAKRESAAQSKQPAKPAVSSYNPKSTKQPSISGRSVEEHQPVGLTAGNGTDSRNKVDEFEEF